jgi:Fe-S cluster assembly protein SufD
LSLAGKINTKPQLEIYANEVKCSHGSTTDKLDEAKIFYLLAHKIGVVNVKKLLVHAFASEVINIIKIEALRKHVEEKISKTFE